LPGPTYPRPFATYVLLERLGAGGMSEVDLARRANDDATGRFVVIKRIRAGSSDERAVRMFLDEARINAQLSHENIAQVYASGREGDEWFLEMEYVPGLDLRQLQVALARAGRLIPPRIAMTVLCGVLRALHYAHARVDQLGRPMRIVHRDVNPRNVMVSSQGEVKLIDFGVARAAERLERTESNQVKGKFAYMAPEQIEANQEMDGRTDLYAVGLMLHELLTGRSPFANLADVQILHRILAGKIPPLPDDLPLPNLPDWRAVHQKALALHPDDRFADGETFRAAVERALAPLGGPAHPREIGALLLEATGDKVREITDRLRGWHESSAPSLLPANVAELRRDHPTLTPPPGAAPVAAPPASPPAGAAPALSEMETRVSGARPALMPAPVDASPPSETAPAAPPPAMQVPVPVASSRTPVLALVGGALALVSAGAVAWGMLREPTPAQVAASPEPVAVTPSPSAPVAAGVATERSGPAPAPVAKAERARSDTRRGERATPAAGSAPAPTESAPPAQPTPVATNPAPVEAAPAPVAPVPQASPAAADRGEMARVLVVATPAGLSYSTDADPTRLPLSVRDRLRIPQGTRTITVHGPWGAVPSTVQVSAGTCIRVADSLQVQVTGCR
jgi:serine/threonine protein kinase